MGGNYLTKTVASRRDSGYFNSNIILQDATLKLHKTVMSRLDPLDFGTTDHRWCGFRETWQIRQSLSRAR